MEQVQYSLLLENLTDVILESQIKIGYTDNPVGLYYPQTSLCSLLGIGTVDETEMQTILDAIPQKPLGKISAVFRNGRWCLTIPPEGVRYVHESVHDSGFLTDFIDLLRGHGVTIEDILAVFRRYSGHVAFREMQNGEFDYLVYFEDGVPDNYRYLISMEMGHATYHRFTPADYEAFGFPRL